MGISIGSTVNKNEKFRSFKSKENIHKKEVGPYRGSQKWFGRTKIKGKQLPGTDAIRTNVPREITKMTKKSNYKENMW